MEAQKGEIILYQREDGSVQIDVKIENETVWLTQEQMATLFGKGRSTITEHISHIFEEGELDEKVVCRSFRQTSKHGAIESKTQEREVKHYNLDVVISVGYRVRSVQGTRFRQWATERLKEYVIKGFTMDDERLKGNAGGNYWKELLNRIRDIRSSEKALYRQVLDLYATSLDYDSKSETTIAFFKVVQNKLHYASSEQTSAELIYHRADSGKDFMGLTTFKGALPTLNEAKIAKNYLTEEELFRLTPMYMKDWIEELDKFSANYGKGVLKGAGNISHEQAIQKATQEYRTYEAKTLSPVEQSYLESLKVLEKSTAKLLKHKKKREL